MRETGILLSVSSLPSKEGIGTLGEGAYAFVDFLASAGVRVWQVLPLTPTREGNSPYSSVAAFALNPLFIDLYDLVKEGLLQEQEISFKKSTRVDYADVRDKKSALLRLAFSRFDKSDKDFAAFVQNNEYKEYAIFATLLDHFQGKAFFDWGEGMSVYDKKKVDAFLCAHEDEYLYRTFTQYVFLRQWNKLKAYANAAGVHIFGDMPIYLDLNSAEAYMHPEMFLLGENGRPSKVAGVPPDYFNEDGQLWGNPLYDWQAMKEMGYKWWRERIRKELAFFDYLRIDHFRGLDRFYAIDADSADAKHGKWLEGPGAALFDGLHDEPIVAEDLGYIDESLRTMLDKVGFPGMKVYEFGLDGDPWNEHKPANYKENVVAYTGTHDNMPFRGHLDSLAQGEFAVAAQDILVQATVLDVPLSEVVSSARPISGPASLEWETLSSVLMASYPRDPAERKAEKQRRVELIERTPKEAFLGLDPVALTHAAVRTLLSSAARLAVVPMQDLLALGAESRMNTPALVSEENWAWRLPADCLNDTLARGIQQVLRETNRA